MKIFVVFFIFIILFLKPSFAEEKDFEENSLGNRGYLYYNPDLPERSPKLKLPEIILREPTAPLEKEKPKPVMEVPVKKPQIPKPLSKPQPEQEILLKKEPELKQPLSKEIEDKNKKISELEQEIASLKERLKITLKHLSLANQKIKELKKNIPSLKPTQTYLVKKGDSLWKIAGKKEIYGNPYKWLLLYHANRDQIYDPNLIFPDMVLIVPRLEEYERKKE